MLVIKMNDSSMRRRVFLGAVGLAAVVTLIFGIDAVEKGLFILGIFDLSVSVISLGILLWAYRKPDSVVPRRIFVAVMSSFFVYLFASGGHGGTGLLFLLLLPLATPLFLGWRHGVAVSLATLLVCVVLAIAGSTTSPLPGIPEDTLLARVAAIYVVSLVLSSLYDSGMQRAQGEVKASEEETRRLNEQLSLQVDRMPIGLIVWDADFRVQNWNPGAAAIFGFTEKEAIGQHPYDIIVPEEAQPPVNDIWHSLLQGDETAHSINENTTKDGRIITCSWTNTPLRDNGGGVFGVLSMVEDITELKEAKEEVRSSGRFLRAVLDSIQDGISVIDKDLNIVSSNRTMETWHSDMPWLAGRKCYQAYHGRSEPCESCPGMRALRTGKPESEEFSVFSEGEEERYLEVYAFPMLDDSGDATVIIELVRDVTAQRQSQAALRNSEERYRLLSENASDIIWTTDMDLKFTYISPSVERGFGYSPEELESCALDVILTPAALEQAMQVFREHMAAEQLDEKDPHKTRTVEVEVICKDGSIAWVEAKAAFLRDQAGQATGIMGIARDITERRQTQEALRESEERHRTLFERTASPIMVIDREGNYIDGNEAALQFLECTREELTAKKVKDFLAHVDEDQLAELARVHRRLWVDGGRIDTEHYVNGKVKTLDLTITPGVWQGQTAVFGVGTDITEQKRIEEELRQSEERYRTILDEMGDGYFELDLAGNLTYANEAMLRILGCSAEEAIGMNYRVFAPTEEEAKAVFEVYNRMYKTGEPLLDYPGRIIRLDGTYGFAETSAFPIRDDRGEIIGFRGVRRDITERKQAEEEAKRQEAYFQQLFESSPDAIVLLDNCDRVVQSNRGFAKLFGYAIEEAVGQPINALVIPEGHEVEASAASRTVLHGGIVRQEVLRKRKDGSKADVSVVGYPIRLDDEVMGMYVIYTDVTQRKKAEEALRRSEERYRTILEEMEDSYFEADLGGHLTFVNSAACRHLGYAMEELIGMSYKEFTDEEDAESVFRMFNEVYRTGNTNRGFPWKIVNKDGSQRYIETSASLLHDDAGGVIGFRGVGRDITERRRMEEQLMLTDRLASIGQLTSGIAHELNNPLTGVIGFSDLLLTRELPSDVKADLETVNREAKRTSTVVKGLLAFARQQGTEKAPIDVNTVIEEVLRLRSYDQRVNNIEVDRRAAPDLPQVLGNGAQLQQVFINIIINAEQAMLEQRGGGRLTITTETEGDLVRVSIADDGPGIRPDAMKSLFTPFFTTKEVGKGTGLGLSICHGIVTEHCGSLYVESEPGQGATFVVELPVMRQEQGVTGDELC